VTGGPRGGPHAGAVLFASCVARRRARIFKISRVCFEALLLAIVAIALHVANAARVKFENFVAPVLSVIKKFIMTFYRNDSFRMIREMTVVIIVVVVVIVVVVLMTQKQSDKLRVLSFVTTTVFLSRIQIEMSTCLSFIILHT